LLAVARVTSLSRRSLYRYLRDTLQLHDLATTGDLAAIHHPRYLREIVQTLATPLTGEPGGERCVGALQQLTDLIDTDGTAPVPAPASAAVSPDLARTRHVRRLAVTALEWLARRAGEEYEMPPTARGAGDGDDAPTGTPVATLPVVMYLPHIRSPFNLGGILRTAAAFGVVGVVLGPDCPSLSHPRTERAAMGALSHLRVVSGGWDAAAALLEQAVPEVASPPRRIALETGGRDIYETRFPPAGVLVAGHEQLGLSEEELAAARAAGEVVSIPHGGPKASLNVGVAVGIALSWWHARTR
jgi:tRNA(Leu) C34 or U34 (ribose-2'-O)-methylase TrmL